MLTETGTGSQPSTALLTATEPAGFYSLKIAFEAASPIPGGPSPTPQIRFIPTVAPTVPAGKSVNNVVLTASAQKSYAVTEDLWIEPGDVISYEVVQSNFSPPLGWAANVFLTRGVDVT